MTREPGYSSAKAFPCQNLDFVTRPCSWSQTSWPLANLHPIMTHWRRYPHSQQEMAKSWPEEKQTDRDQSGHMTAGTVVAIYA